MLYQIGIKDGFAQIKGSGRHIKIISAATQLRIQAQDSNGRVLLDSKFRAPMATELTAPAAVINIYADEQTVELWYSNQPLEYLQLTAVGASTVTAKKIVAKKGKTKLLDSAVRTAFRVTSNKNIFVGNTSVSAAGWPLAAGEKEQFETIGEVWALNPVEPFNWSLIAGASAAQYSVAKPSTMYHYKIFKGRVYFGDNTGLRVMDDEGAVSSLGMAGLRAISVYLGKLYIVTALSEAYGGVYESADGVTFLKIANIQPGPALKKLASDSLTMAGFVLNDYLNFVIPEAYSSADLRYALNLFTGELIIAPPGLKYSEFRSDVMVYCGYRKTWITLKGQKRYWDNGTWKNFGVNQYNFYAAGEDGRLWGISTVAGASLEQFDIDGKELQVLSGRRLSPLKNIEGTAGAFLWQGNGSTVEVIYIADGEDPAVFNVTGQSAFEVDINIGAIDTFSFTASAANKRKKLVEGLPSFEPAIVNILEFIV